MKPVILAIALAGVLLLAAPPPVRADESGTVVRQVRRVSPTETTIIYRDTRPSARRSAPRPAGRTPEFREYDLQPAAPPPARRASVSAPALPAAPSYSETWSPGPTMAAGTGGFSGGTTFAVSPTWGGSWWGGGFGPRPGWHGGGTWHGPWNQPWGLNTHTFPWYSVNPFAATPYLSPFPGPPVPTWGTVPGPTVRCP